MGPFLLGPVLLGFCRGNGDKVENFLIEEIHMFDGVSCLLFVVKSYTLNEFDAYI